MKEETYYEHTTVRPAPAGERRVSWGAIFAGLVVAIVMQMMLTLLGVAIGASTIDPAEGQTPGRGLAIGSGIWLLVSSLVSMFTGACVAGRLSGGPRRADGLLHGIVTWALAEIAMILLVTTTLGNILGGTTRMLTSAISGAQSPGQDTMTAAMNNLKRSFPQAGALLPPTGRNDQPSGQLTAIAQQDPEVGAALARMTAQGGSDKAPAERDQVVNLLTTKHGMDSQQASALVTQWNQNAQQALAQGQQQAREIGDKAAKGISQGALWAFIGLVLALAVAAWGGWVGTASLPRYREVNVAPAA